jgi:hypothetical protein
MTNQRVTSLYDLMDSAYDAPIIKERSSSLGHVPIIDSYMKRPNHGNFLRVRYEAIWSVREGEAA